jgi:DNA-binding LacI/PurR family transcriptional regulator
MTRNMQKRAPRITDVAKLAGVSTATVSRALSKPDTVAESTRNAVLAAARESGYRVNLSARNLRRQRTGAIVVMVPDLGNPFFSRILSGIEEGLSKADLNMLVVDTRQAHLKPQLVLNYLHATRADGIIALDGSLPDSVLSATLFRRRRSADHLCVRMDAAGQVFLRADKQRAWRRNGDCPPRRSRTPGHRHDYRSG